MITRLSEPEFFKELYEKQQTETTNRTLAVSCTFFTGLTKIQKNCSDGDIGAHFDNDILFRWLGNIGNGCDMATPLSLKLSPWIDSLVRHVE